MTQTRTSKSTTGEILTGKDSNRILTVREVSILRYAWKLRKEELAWLDGCFLRHCTVKELLDMISDDKEHRGELEYKGQYYSLLTSWSVLEVNHDALVLISFRKQEKSKLALAVAMLPIMDDIDNEATEEILRHRYKHISID